MLGPLIKDGIDPQFVGLANFGMLLAVAMDRYFGGRTGDLSELARQFNSLSTSGFAKDKNNVTNGRRPMATQLTIIDCWAARACAYRR